MKKVAVIGAGFGGLSCAIRLAHQGYQVEVFEQLSTPGGKASTNTLGGYRFDTGPSLLTMKEEFEELFRSCGEEFSDFLEIVPLHPLCNYFFSDGSRLSSYTNRAHFREEIARISPEPASHLDRFLDYIAGIYRRTQDIFLRHALGWRSLRSVFSLPFIDPLRTMHRAVSGFFRDPRLIQLFDRYATYNGSSPYKVPATLNIIPHVEYNMGAYTVKEGIYAISQALYQLALKQGVVFHFSQPVEAILHEGRRLKGIQVGGEKLDAAIVVSNVDVFTTYHRLLKDSQAYYARLYRRLEPSSSGLVFYWGISRSFPELCVNNIFFSSDYPGEFRDIFENRTCPADPTVYINITSKESPQDAPPDGENWFVLVNAPPHTGQDWKKETERVRRAVLSRLSQTLGQKIEPLIVAEDSLNPAQIEQKTGSYQGGLYGISSNSRVAAFLRHPNCSRRYRGLYFAGGSAHPGGGMPLALLSGKIAAEWIMKKEGR